jgi:hypothetical protein
VRTVAAWWLVIGAGLSNGEAGRLLKMSPVSVSRAIGRVRMESKRNPTGDIVDALKLRYPEILGHDGVFGYLEFGSRADFLGVSQNLTCCY